MTLSPRLRKLLLTVHVGLSVGWIGAVLAYVALDVAGATSEDPDVIRSAHFGMKLIAGKVIVPLAVGSLLTGIAVSLATRWGLFRHYWVVFSLVLTTVATAVLLIEIETINHLAHIAARPTASGSDLRVLGNTLPHSIGGSVLLLVILALNMYKPRGMTRYGWRKERENPVSPDTAPKAGGADADREGAP